MFFKFSFEKPGEQSHFSTDCFLVYLVTFLDSVCFPVLLNFGLMFLRKIDIRHMFLFLVLQDTSLVCSYSPSNKISFAL